MLFSVTALLVLPFLLFCILSIKILEPRLLSQLETQTITAALGVQRRVDYAAEVFGGLHTLRDVKPVLDKARLSAPDISFLALAQSDGTLLHLSADSPDVAMQALDDFASLGAQVEFDNSKTTLSETIDISETVPALRVEGNGIALLVNRLTLGGAEREISGALYVGTNIDALDRLKRDIWIDVGVITLAIILVAIELLLLTYAVYVTRPTWVITFLIARLQDMDLRFTARQYGRGIARRVIERLDRIIGHVTNHADFKPNFRRPKGGHPHVIRAPALSHIRLPLFLFFLSEAVLRPILPQYLGSFVAPDSDPAFMTGLLMASFMAASLFSVLFGSMLAEQEGGPKRIFLWGAVFAMLGMVGHVVVLDVWLVLLMRMITGFGYGLVYAAAQIYISQNTDRSWRTSGFSLILAVIVAAEICGPAVGGILADRFGIGPVLVTATVLIIASGVASSLLMPRFAPDVTNPSDIPDRNRAVFKLTGQANMRQTWAMIKPIVNNMRFLTATVCFAIPAKALLTGGLFLLVPLCVFENGGSVTESARVLMGYGLAILLLVSVLSRRC